MATGYITRVSEIKLDVDDKVTLKLSREGETSKIEIISNSNKIKLLRSQWEQLWAVKSSIDNCLILIESNPRSENRIVNDYPQGASYWNNNTA